MEASENGPNGKGHIPHSLENEVNGNEEDASQIGLKEFKRI